MDRPICIECNKNLASKKARRKDGTWRYDKRCWSCRTSEEAIKKRRARKRQHGEYEKLSFCEECKFVAVHPCQLAVDHIDGNRHNEEIDNFQTLCHNCHSLKSLLNGDNDSRRYLEVS